MPPPLKVAIVGGGWAGLAAATELCAAGAAVTLFEAAKQLGGRARSISLDGRTLDNGQHIMIGAYRETLRLMRQVGADPGQLLQRVPLTLDYPGAGFRLALPRLPAPLNLALGLIAAKGCSLADKLAAARFMNALRASDYRLVADISVAELLDRHRQQGPLRRLLWEALCLAALNTRAREASAQIFVNVLRDSLGGKRADTDLLLPSATLGDVFPEAAARFIAAHGGRIRLSTRIETIATGLSVAGEDFAHVILATAPQHAQSLLAAIPETSAVAAQLASYDYEPIATVYLAYPSDFTLPRAMLGLAQGAHGQWAFDQGRLTGSAGVIACVLSAQGAWQGLDNEGLAGALHGELQEALGRSFAPPQWQRVVREKRATFACRPGLPRPAAQTPLAGLWLAGDYVCADYPATLEAAVRSGVAATRAILSGG